MLCRDPKQGATLHTASSLGWHTVVDCRTGTWVAAPGCAPQPDSSCPLERVHVSATDPASAAAPPSASPARPGAAGATGPSGSVGSGSVVASERPSSHASSAAARITSGGRPSAIASVPFRSGSAPSCQLANATATSSAADSAQHSSQQQRAPGTADTASVPPPCSPCPAAISHAFRVRGCPGCVIFPAALPPEVQLRLSAAALESFPAAPARTNHTPSYGELHGLWQAARGNAVLEHASDHTLSETKRARTAGAAAAERSGASTGARGGGYGPGSSTCAPDRVKGHCADGVMAGVAPATAGGDFGSGVWAPCEPRHLDRRGVSRPGVVTARRLLQKLRWASLGPPYGARCGATPACLWAARRSSPRACACVERAGVREHACYRNVILGNGNLHVVHNPSTMFALQIGRDGRTTTAAPRAAFPRSYGTLRSAMRRWQRLQLRHLCCQRILWHPRPAVRPRPNALVSSFQRQRSRARERVDRRVLPGRSSALMRQSQTTTTPAAR